MYKIWHKPLRIVQRGAFSLLEVLITVALLGILAVVAFESSHRLRQGANQTKLDSDVAAINQSIKVYLANGGSFAGVTEPAAVLNKLKTRRGTEDGASFAGLRSDMIDHRIQPVAQTQSEAQSKAARAVWNSTAQRFEVAYQGSGGIARFELSEAEGRVDHGVETRTAGPIDLNRGNGWIWNYNEVAASARTPVHNVPVQPVAPPTPVAVAPPGRLSAPVLSSPGGTYRYDTFPASITITNPNGTGNLVYSKQWSGTGIQWQSYQSPISMQPGDSLLVRVQATAPEHTDSVTVGGTYEVETIDLSPATFTPSSNYLDLGVNDTVTMQIVNPNPADYNSEIEYSILGGAFTRYTEPLALSPATYANGFEITARVVPGSGKVGFRSSTSSSQFLSVKLKAPLIDKKQAESIFTMTLSDPNPVGKGSMRYLIQDLNNGSRTAWSNYVAPFLIDGDKYIKGFEVISYAVATATRYLDSAESNVQGRSFFGTKVAERVVMVLDVSGSMSINGRLTKVKDEARRLLSTMPTTGKMAIISFSSGVNTRFPYQQTTPSKVTEAQTIVNSLVASGSTNYIAALTTARNLVNTNPEIEQVVFLSDGAPDGGTFSHAAILALVDQIAAKGVALSPIGYEMTTAAEKKLIQDMKDRGVPKPKN